MKHSHYFKDVSTLEFIDVYRVLTLFSVNDHCIGHAIKKLLCAGGRGAKSLDTDVQEAIDTLHRWQEIQIENMKAVELDTKVKAWEQPDYCESEAYPNAHGEIVRWGSLLFSKSDCFHPDWHQFQSLKYEQCTLCGYRRPIIGV